MDVASMDVEQMLEISDKHVDLDDDIESARESFENNGGVVTSEEIKINGYFNSPKKMSSSHKRTFFEGGMQISQDYLSLIDNDKQPLLYDFFQKNIKFSYKDFYSFATKNYIELNEKELVFINQRFYPNNYTHLIFENALQSQHTINAEQFDSLLKKNFNETFEDIYIQNILIKYALNNFSGIGENKFNTLSEKVDLSLSQDNFLEKAIDNKINITNTKFFKNFTFKSQSILKNYLALAINEQWNKTIIYFCKNLPNISLNYLKESTQFNSVENINFERLFLYFNPDKINDSHLSQENLDIVFNKLYNNLSDKNLLTSDNLDFMKSLGQGVYKFIEIIYQKNPQDINNVIDNTTGVMFNNHNNVGFWNYNNSYNYNILYNLLDNHEFLNESLQDSFNKNFLIHYFNETSNIQEQQLLLKYALCDSDFYQLIIQSKAMDHEKSHVLIYDLIVSFSKTEIEKQDFVNNLHCFDIKTLETYKTHLNFSLSIMKHINNDVKDEIRETFYKVFLNKNMLYKLENETEEKKEKRLKI